MPRIQTYERQYSANAGIPARQANAQDAGGTGTLELGRAIQSAGQDAGFAMRQLQMAESQRQATEAHHMLQTMRAEYTRKALEYEAQAQPGDTGLIDVFLTGESGEGDPGSFKWATDEYRARLTDPYAQQVFDRGVADLSTHFITHFAQVQAGLSGTYAKQQAIKFINDGQNTVYLDPDQYTKVLEKTFAAIDDPGGIYFRPGMNAGKREEIKRLAQEELSWSAVQGRIRQDPRLALKKLEAGIWDDDITGEKKAALIGAAETRIHALEVKERQVDAELLKMQKQLASASHLKFVQQLAAHDANPAAHKMPDPVEVAESDFAKFDVVGSQTFINVLHARSKEILSAPQRTNPVVQRRLFNAIHLPDGDPKKIQTTEPIYREYMRGQLSWDDMKHLEKEVLSPAEGGVGREKKRFFDAIEKKVVTYDAFQVLADPTAPERFLFFQQDVEQKIQQYLKEGKDPRVLFDRTNKEYMGTDAVLKDYRKNPLDVFRERAGVPSIQQPSTTQQKVPEPAQPQSKRRSLNEIFQGVRP